MSAQPSQPSQPLRVLQHITRQGSCCSDTVARDLAMTRSRARRICRVLHEVYGYLRPVKGSGYRVSRRGLQRLSSSFTHGGLHQ